MVLLMRANFASQANSAMSLNMNGQDLEASPDDKKATNPSPLRCELRDNFGCGIRHVGQSR